MTYRGTAKNGAIVVEDALRLPDGTSVRIEVDESDHALDLSWSDPDFSICKNLSDGTIFE
jgi:hypothetical protein